MANNTFGAIGIEDSKIPGSGFGLGSITGFVGNVGDYLGDQSLGDLTQGAGLGFGIYDELLGMGGKIKKQQYGNLKSQGELLRQNIDANKYALDKTKKFDTMISNDGIGLGKVNIG
jgi:hypothetical protein